MSSEATDTSSLPPDVPAARAHGLLASDDPRDVLDDYTMLVYRVSTSEALMHLAEEFSMYASVTVATVYDDRSFVLAVECKDDETTACELQAMAALQDPAVVLTYRRRCDSSARDMTAFIHAQGAPLHGEVPLTDAERLRISTSVHAWSYRSRASVSRQARPLT